MAGKSGKKETSALAKLYLKSYNFVEIVGWSYILYLVLEHYLASSRQETLWDATRLSVIIFQNAALLEIFNAATGLVPSNPVITTFQVLSRVVVVCAVLLGSPEEYAASSPGLPLALLAWSITEIVRYSYYFMNLLGFVPRFLLWLRYSTFIVLYPIGITGELLCMYEAQRYGAVNTEAWSYVLPNAWNFTFSYRYFLIIVMLTYIPVFPRLYLHMFAQRRKMLGDSSTKKTH